MGLIGEATIQKARKQYSCWWCGQHINSGDEYARWLWKDGGLLVVRAHPECKNMWDEYSHEYGEPYETGFANHDRPQIMTTPNPPRREND